MFGKLSHVILLPLALLFQVVLGRNHSKLALTASNRRHSHYHDDFPDIACPDKFSYEQNEAGDYFGKLVVRKKGKPSVMDLEVNMTVSAKIKRNKNINISLLSDQQQLLDGKEVVYAISFPRQNPLPKLIQVKFNNRVICSGHPDRLKFEAPQTAMWAKATIRVGNREGDSVEGSDESGDESREEPEEPDKSDGHETDESNGPETDEPDGQETDEPGVQQTVEPDVQQTVESSGQETGESSGQETDESSGQETDEPDGQETDEPYVPQTPKPKKKHQYDGEPTEDPWDIDDDDWDRRWLRDYGASFRQPSDKEPPDTFLRK